MGAHARFISSPLFTSLFAFISVLSILLFVVQARESTFFNKEPNERKGAAFGSSYEDSLRWALKRAGNGVYGAGYENGEGSNYGGTGWNNGYENGQGSDYGGTGSNNGYENGQGSGNRGAGSDNGYENGKGSGNRGAGSDNGYENGQSSGYGGAGYVSRSGYGAVSGGGYGDRSEDGSGNAGYESRYGSGYNRDSAKDNGSGAMVLGLEMDIFPVKAIRPEETSVI